MICYRSFAREDKRNCPEDGWWIMTNRWFMILSPCEYYVDFPLLGATTKNSLQRFSIWRSTNAQINIRTFSRSYSWSWHIIFRCPQTPREKKKESKACLINVIECRGKLVWKSFSDFYNKHGNHAKRDKGLAPPLKCQSLKVDGVFDGVWKLCRGVG